MTAARQSKFLEEQIALILRLAESRTSVVEICRKLGATEQSFYRWKGKFIGMVVAGLRRLKVLERENPKHWAVAADLTLDKHLRQAVIAKNMLADLPKSGVVWCQAPRDMQG